MGDTLRERLLNARNQIFEDGYNAILEPIDDAIAELDRLEAEVKKSRYAGELPQPMFWAYRYHDCIRFNGGSEVNGSRPIEAIPLYTAEQMRAFIPTPDVATEPVQAAGEPWVRLPIGWDIEREFAPHSLIRVHGPAGHDGRRRCFQVTDTGEPGDWHRDIHDFLWLCFFSTRAPAEVPNQDKGYLTPTKQETAEKPKPVSLEQAMKDHLRCNRLEDWAKIQDFATRMVIIDLVRELDERGRDEAG